ncbi:MAG: DEAD/DEAH box helicase, partial [Thermoplasmatota archaeon]
MNMKSITIPPSYLRLTDKGKHPFQDKISDLERWKKDTLIVDAPTGSGKTYGFIELAKKEIKSTTKTLMIVEPTRRLSRE